MNLNSIWCAIYVAALIAIPAILLWPPATPSTTRPRPAAETCVDHNGWKATIEQSGTDWACVMRKGNKTRAFFYN